MKKLLYISVNSKPEELSASKTVARKFINKFLEKNKDFQVEEIDLYKAFVENELRCRIKEEVLKETKFDKKEVRQVRFKVITIPQSQYILQLDE